MCMMVRELLGILFRDLKDLGSWRTLHQSRMRSMPHGMIVGSRCHRAWHGLDEYGTNIVDGSEASGGGSGDSKVSQHVCLWGRRADGSTRTIVRGQGGRRPVIDVTRLPRNFKEPFKRLRRPPSPFPWLLTAADHCNGPLQRTTATELCDTRTLDALIQLLCTTQATVFKSV